MTHTSHRFTLRQATLASLLLGILTVATSTQSVLLGQLTGGGATVFGARPTENSAELLPTLHGAAPVIDAQSFYAQNQLLIGMLLVLLGFALHWLTIRLYDERRVPVHAGKPSRLQTVHLWVERYLDTDIRRFRG